MVWSQKKWEMHKLKPRCRRVLIKDPIHQRIKRVSILQRVVVCYEHIFDFNLSLVFDATIIPNPSDTYDENNSMYQSTYNTVDTSDHNHESIVENSFINEYVNDGENNDPDHHSEEAVESMDQEDQPYDEYDYNDYYYTQNDVYVCLLHTIL